MVWSLLFVCVLFICDEVSRFVHVTMRRLFCMNACGLMMNEVWIMNALVNTQSTSPIHCWGLYPCQCLIRPSVVYFVPIRVRVRQHGH
jgi:hypothetical protein